MLADNLAENSCECLIQSFVYLMDFTPLFFFFCTANAFHPKRFFHSQRERADRLTISTRRTGLRLFLNVTHCEILVNMDICFLF